MEVAKDLFVARFECLIFLLKIFKYVSDAQADACSFVAVGRTNSFAGGSHFVLSLRCFVGSVEHAVRREDEVSASADVESVGQCVACGLQFLCFCHEEVGRNDAAVSDDVHFAFVKDAGGNGAKHELLSFKNDGVTCVGTAGETSHHVVARSEIVNHFSFAFVAEHDAEQGINFSLFHSHI